MPPSADPAEVVYSFLAGHMSEQIRREGMHCGGGGGGGFGGGGAGGGGDGGGGCDGEGGGGDGGGGRGGDGGGGDGGGGEGGGGDGGEGHGKTVIRLGKSESVVHPGARMDEKGEFGLSPQ